MKSCYPKAVTKTLAFACVLLASCAARAQQNPNGQLPVTSFPHPYLFLIRDPLVLDELKLTSSQQQALAELNDGFDAGLWSMRNKSAEHIAQTIEQSTTKAKETLAKLLSAEQLQRIAEIERWTLGTRAFLGDDLPAELDLNDGQLKRIRQAMEESEQKLSDLRAESTSPEAQTSFDKKARALKTDEQKKILAVISPEQRAKWVELLGKRIDVAKLGRVKFKAPPLYGEGDWINASPMAAEQLEGKVIALHFYAFQCINCKRNQPAYREWHQAFADQGLVVLGVHTPELSSEREVDRVRQNARDADLQFPIVTDNQKQNWDAWGNSMWPSVYLIDKQGYVRYWWYGELNWQGAEGDKLMRARIAELLDE
ncbi:redoxin domain-containing protein [Aeoliella mucimassa]|uniref:redoxin domain-containing protein n=1 Tax=Aeoliella mucimassa TaxID=2527972 RepID=UPI0018D2A5B8|nr:redoxin domain-containing protein [Aeoliella mucimassa]